MVNGLAAIGAIGLVTGCGDVSPKKMLDAQVVTGDDAAVDSSPTDTALVDAGPTCYVDEFNGSALQAHWTVTVGAAPTATVANGSLTITESTIADTPSNPNESWINNLDTDKGNQLGWAHPIGTGDFVLRTEANWTNTTGELHIGVVGVVDTSGTIAAMVGAWDGGSNFNGYAYASLHGVAGASDMNYAGPFEEPGSGDFRIERTGTAIKFFVDNVEVLSGTDTSAISHVAIIHAPYRLSAATYGYGTVEVTRVEICR